MLFMKNTFSEIYPPRIISSNVKILKKKDEKCKNYSVVGKNK